LVKIEIDAPQFNVNEKEVHEEEDVNLPLSKNEMRDRAMKKILASRKK